MKRKLFITFLCLCMMVLSFMPMTAFADGTSIPISSIDITVSGYDVGSPIANANITTSTEGLTVTPSGAWLDNKYNEVSGNFKLGQRYCHYVYLKAQDGYELGEITDDTIKGILKVNGKTPTTAWAWDVEDDGSIKILFFMDMLTESLPSLSLTVNNFEAGNTWEESNVIANSDNFWVQNAKLIYKGIIGDHDVTVDEPMEAHQSYQLYLYIWTEPGYVFDIATLEKEDVSISVNGQIVNPVAIRDGGDNGRSIVMDVDVPELHDYSDWETVTSPDCENKGSEKRVCEVCSLSETRDIAPLGHDWETDYTVDKEATCTTEGSKSIHCSRCDAVKDGAVIPVAAHSYGEWVVTTPATSTEAGSREKVCSVCGDKVVEAISATGGGTTASEKPSDPNIPKTGDTSNIALYGLLLLLSGVGAISGVIYNRCKGRGI